MDMVLIHITAYVAQDFQTIGRMLLTGNGTNSNEPTSDNGWFLIQLRFQQHRLHSVEWYTG